MKSRNESLKLRKSEVRSLADIARSGRFDSRVFPSRVRKFLTGGVESPLTEVEFCDLFDDIERCFGLQKTIVEADDLFRVWLTADERDVVSGFAQAGKVDRLSFPSRLSHRLRYPQRLTERDCLNLFTSEIKYLESHNLNVPDELRHDVQIYQARINKSN